MIANNIPNLSELNTQTVISKIFKISNIPLMEELIYEKSRQLRNFQDAEKDGALDFGPMFNICLLNKWYKKITKDIGDFFRDSEQILIPTMLQLDKPEPQITNMEQSILADYFENDKLCYNSYNRDLKYVTLYQGRESLVVPIYIHEMAHPNFDMLDLPDKDYHAVNEGLARAAQRNLSEKYANELHNDCYRYTSLEFDVGELRSCYLHFMSHLGQTPSIELLLNTGIIDNKEKKYRAKHNLPTGHAIGNTFFLLLEARYGTGFYQDILSCVPKKGPDLVIVSEEYIDEIDALI